MIHPAPACPPFAGTPPDIPSSDPLAAGTPAPLVIRALVGGLLPVVAALEARTRPHHDEAAALLVLAGITDEGVPA